MRKNKTINESIMTADEITQLLYNRNIVFLFNENTPNNEHDKTLKFLRETLKTESKKYTFEQCHLYAAPKSHPKEGASLLLDMIFTTLQSIKDSDLHDHTIIFDGDFLNILADMLNNVELSDISHAIGSSPVDGIEEFKTRLERAWINANYPAQNYKCIKEYVTDTFMWNEFISTLFQCKNIHAINYDVEDCYKVKNYCKNDYTDEVIVMDTDDYSHIRMFKEILAELMYKDSHSVHRIDGSYLSATSVNDCLRRYKPFFIDLEVLEGIYKDDEQ